MPKQISDQAVYDATLKTLIQRGYAGATTKRIAQAAGVNEVTLFRKYGNKAQLVAAAVNDTSLQLQGNAVVYSGDVAADLLHVVGVYLNSAEKHSQLFPLIMSEMARYPELKETLTGPFSVVEQIGELFVRYQKEGVLHVEHPLKAVGALLGPIIVYVMLLSAPTPLEIPPINLPDHVQRFLNGRAKPASEQ